MRLNYPTNIKLIRMMCTGKLDAIFLLKAFENGADGAYVVGCMEGDCHFMEGNIRAKKRVKFVKKCLEEAGVSGERVTMYNLSASQGPLFAQYAQEMTEKIKSLGPSPVRTGGGNELERVARLLEGADSPAPGGAPVAEASAEAGGA